MNEVLHQKLEAVSRREPIAALNAIKEIECGDMLFFSAGGADGIGHSTISLGGSLLIYHGGKGGVPTIVNIDQNANHHEFYTARRFKP